MELILEPFETLLDLLGLSRGLSGRSWGSHGLSLRAQVVFFSDFGHLSKMRPLSQFGHLGTLSRSLLDSMGIPWGAFAASLGALRLLQMLLDASLILLRHLF